VPSGHCAFPSGQLTDFTAKALVFSEAGILSCPLVQNPPAPQVNPFGQQCSSSLQQTAFGRGQQPYSPEPNKQQVFPSGHSDLPSGQEIVCTFEMITCCTSALLFTEAFILSLPFVQNPPAPQVKPFGQQCS
jgi:hypothetical protein